MRRVVAWSVLAVLLLGGCGDRDDDREPGGSPPMDDGVVEPTGRDRLPSGIVTVKHNYSAGTRILSVHDVVTGKTLDTVVAPAEAEVSRRAAFDATATRLAYVVDCDLRWAAVTGDLYVQTAQWQPPQAYGQGRQCFREPTVGADGRITATVSASQLEPGRTVSVDPAQPGTPPRDEGAGHRREEKVFRIAGAAKSDVRVYVRGDVLDSVWVTGTRPGGDFLDDFSYRCGVRVDDTSFLCAADRDQEDQYYGSVALTTVDRAASTVTVKQVAPPSKGGRPTVLLSPDRRQVAINDATGWYTTGLDGSAPPVRQPLSDRADLGEILFWI